MNGRETNVSSGGNEQAVDGSHTSHTRDRHEHRTSTLQ